MRSLPLSVASLALAAGTAKAQPDDSPPPRVGFELGVGLQIGEIACEGAGSFCDDFTEAGGLNVNAAYFFNPSIGLSLDLWWMVHPEDSFTFSHLVSTLGLKWRPFAIVTLGAGAGAGYARIDSDGPGLARSEDAFAVMAAASVDLIRGRRWALSVEARYGVGFYGDDDDATTTDLVAQNLGLGAGVTFSGF